MPTEHEQEFPGGAELLDAMVTVVANIDVSVGGAQWMTVHRQPLRAAGARELPRTGP